MIGEPRWLSLLRAATPTIVVGAVAVTVTVLSLWFTAEPRRYVRVEAKAEADTTVRAVVPVCEGSPVRYFPAPVHLRIRPLP